LGHQFQVFSRLAYEHDHDSSPGLEAYEVDSGFRAEQALGERPPAGHHVPETKPEPTEKGFAGRRGDEA
jgi:hypothetical protein